jgi:hypothetical protein
LWVIVKTVGVVIIPKNNGAYWRISSQPKGVDYAGQLMPPFTIDVKSAPI